MAMLAVAGTILGAALGYNARGPSGTDTAVAQPDVESAAIAAHVAALASQDVELAPTWRSGAVQMFSEGDIGVLPPLGVYDPLGLIETRDMRRYEIMEIK